MPIQFACQCGKKLQVKDELGGRKVRCPGCSEVITIPMASGKKPAAAPTPATSGRKAAAPEKSAIKEKPPAKKPTAPPPPDVDDEDDEQMEEEEEQPKKKGKKKGKKSGKKKGSGMGLLLGIGGGVAALAVLAVVGYMFLFPSTNTGPIGGVGGGGQGGGGNNNGGMNQTEDHLAAIPVDKNILVTMQVSKVWEKLPEKLKDFIKNADTDGDFEKLSAAGMDPANMARATYVMALNQPVSRPEDALNQLLIFITTTSPYDAEKLREVMQDSAIPVEADGKIFAMKGGKPAPPKGNPGIQQQQEGMYAGLISDKTAVFGIKSLIEPMVTNGLSMGNNTELASVIELAKQNDFVVAGTIPQAFKDMAQQQPLPPQAKAFEVFLKMSLATLVANYSDDLTVKLDLTFPDNPSAVQAAGAVQFAKAAAVGMLAAQQEQMKTQPGNEMFLELMNAGSKYLNELKIESPAEVLSASLTIDGATINNTLEKALPSADKVKDLARKTVVSNNLKQIGLAMHNFNDAYRSFPPAAFGKGLSWRVAILPFIGEEALYKEFNLKEPWDSPHNKQLLTKMPKVYDIPGSKAEPGHTYFQVFVGPGAMFETAGDRPTLGKVQDGTSNTFLVVEAGKTVPWTAPQDLSFQPNGPLPTFGNHFQDGFFTLFCDGSTRVTPSNTPEPTIRAYITRAGGEPIR